MKRFFAAAGKVINSHYGVVLFFPFIVFLQPVSGFRPLSDWDDFTVVMIGWAWSWLLPILAVRDLMRRPFEGIEDARKNISHAFFFGLWAAFWCMFSFHPQIVKMLSQLSESE